MGTSSVKRGGTAPLFKDRGADPESTSAWASERSDVKTVQIDDDDEAPTIVGGRVGATPEHRPLAPGTVIERYFVIEHVGAGGLGDVYAAYDPELDRRIAIKLLKPMAPLEHDAALGDPTTRLLREAQAMARLRHPNVVTVYDVGTTAGQIFMAMEFVNGTTLSKWFRAAPRRWTDVREALSQAGRGLAHAHDAGIVHRDFKPQNVIVGEDGRVVVLDFGLARGVESSGAVAAEDGFDLLDSDAGPSLLEQQMTDVGVLLGTPSYMAPELFDGSPGTAHSDQFAFSVTLYEMLHGERPFRSTSLGEHIRKVRAGKIPPFRPNRDVPQWLHRVAVRGLAATPAQRWPSIATLIDALHLDRTRRRRRLLGVAVAIPLLSAAVAGGALALRPPPTQAEMDLTERLVTEARAAAAKGYFVHPPVDEPAYPTAYAKVLELEELSGSIADAAENAAGGLRDEMASTLVRLGDTYYDKPGGPPFAADFYAMALVFDPKNTRAQARATVTPGELAALRSKAAGGAFSETELVAAEPLAVLADEDTNTRKSKVAKLRRRKVAASASTQARLEQVLGETRDLNPGGVTEVGAPRREGVAARARKAPVEPAPPPAAPATESAAVTAAVDPGADARPDKVVKSSPEPVRRDPKQAKAEARLGRKAFNAGDFAAAERRYHKALQHDRRCLPALEGLTDLHFERSQYEKAVSFARRATAIAPRRARVHIKLGDAYFKVFRYTEAKRAYQRASDLGSKQAQGRLDRLRSKVAG